MGYPAKMTGKCLVYEFQFDKWKSLAQQKFIFMDSNLTGKFSQKDLRKKQMCIFDILTSQQTIHFSLSCLLKTRLFLYLLIAEKAKLPLWIYQQELCSENRNPSLCANCKYEDLTFHCWLQTFRSILALMKRTKV